MIAEQYLQNVCMKSKPFQQMMELKYTIVYYLGIHVCSIYKVLIKKEFSTAILEVCFLTIDFIGHS